jgi:hypothetical protein
MSGWIDLSSYEETIKARAEAHDQDVVRERGGLTVLDDEGGESWHRLGGAAEALHDRRHEEGGRYLEPGRWVRVDGPQSSGLGMGDMDWLPHGVYR